MTVDFGKFPVEQLSGHNEFGRGVCLICLNESGCRPAGDGKSYFKVMSGSVQDSYHTAVKIFLRSGGMDASFTFPIILVLWDGN